MTELEAAKVEVKELESKLAELKKEIRQVRNNREELKAYEKVLVEYGIQTTPGSLGLVRIPFDWLQ